MASKREHLNNGDLVLNGRYEILKCIHSKGMANVYLVRDTHLGKQWCLKEIRKSQAGRKNIEFISLMQEANILRSLNNEKIPRITTIENDGDSLFVVMDFLDGVTLKDFVQEKGRIPEDMAVKWMIQIVQAVGYLHSERSNKKPIFYRDMKPDNLMIRSNGVINIFDFGISVRLEYPNQLPEYTLGTPGYVAPEQQKKNLPMDLRSDIYSMGRTFYFMLTGIDPRGFIGEKLKPISDWSPDVSPVLISIVNKCMADNPNDRYQTCEELQYALENYKFSDEKHRSSAKRKVKVVISLAVTGFVMGICSIIPFGINGVQSKDAYDKALIVAQQSGRLEDYDKVLTMNPLNISPYEGYIDAVKEDGIFTLDEEKGLLNHINPNLMDLKKDKDYGNVAFDIGKLYWFYYPSEDGKTLSIKWFEDAISSDFNKEEATVYYNLGVFNRDISKSVKEASDSGMYKKYWNNLLLVQNMDTSDIITIQTNISIAECISTYAYNLKKDGVSYEDISKEIGILNSFVNSYKVDSSTLDTIKSMYSELKSDLNGLESRVKVVYELSGGGK
jgi:serine/threonine-protein kinase